jgi:hypothetical protein
MFLLLVLLLDVSDALHYGTWLSGPEICPFFGKDVVPLDIDEDDFMRDWKLLRIDEDRTSRNC